MRHGPDPPPLLQKLRQPRSVYIAFEVFPRPKGASSHIAEMAEALARRHAPVLLLCCGLSDMPTLQPEGDITIYRHKVQEPNVLRRTVEFGNFVHDSLSALQRRPDLCVFRDPWSGLPALTALPETPAVFEVNGLPSWEIPYAYPYFKANGALQAKINDLERFCLHASDAVFAVSQVTQDALAAYGLDSARVTVIPNCAPDFFFRTNGGPCSIDVLNKGRWFGYFGSLHPWQGINVLVDAWSRVAEKWPDVKLLLVFGRRSTALKQLTKRMERLGLTDRVLVHPPMSPEELAAAMRRMEFTCAPLTETLRNVVQGCCPVKIVESMAAGTPVLASNLRVTRALITPGTDGYLACPGDVRDWALAIQRLLSDADLRDRLAAGAKNKASNCFTLENMSDRLNEVILIAGNLHGSSPQRRRVYK